jgi:PAS domain S-box-containing protein
VNKFLSDPGRHPAILAGLSIAMTAALFRAWALVEARLSPTLTEQELTWLHMAQGLSSTLLVAGMLIGLVYFCRRETRELKRRVEGEERRFAKMLSQSTDAIIGVDRAGKIVYWNRGAELLYGCQAQEILGSSFEDLLPDVSRRGVGGGEPGPVERFLMRRLTGDGKPVSVLVTRNLGDGEARECVGCRAIEQNLMELKDLERQLSQSEKMATLGEMAAGLAHEIKNPLAGIAGAIQVLGDSMPADDSRRDVVAKVLEQVQRIDRTVRDLLAYSRPKPPRFEPSDLNQLVESHLGVVSLLPGDRVRIVRQLAHDLPPVAVDGELFGQALSNLFINAIHAMSRGGTLTVGTALSGDQIRITVRDTGEGIPEANLKRIFAPFYTTKTRGTGLGLSICQRVVEMHRGTIAVTSRIGQGTEFVLTLPQAGEAVKTEAR